MLGRGDKVKSRKSKLSFGAENLQMHRSCKWTLNHHCWSILSVPDNLDYVADIAPIQDWHKLITKALIGDVCDNVVIVA